MDHPRNPARIRRHNSLPSTRLPRSSILPSRLRMNKNPYVGSFRHSPPTTFGSVKAGLMGTNPSVSFSFSSPVSLRSSPYIGWFRHAPPSTMRLHKVDIKHLAFLDKCQQLLSTIPVPNKVVEPHLEDIICGRLRGGGRDRYIVTAHSMEHSHGHDLVKEGSSTLKLLSKLGSWFHFSPLVTEDDGRDEISPYKSQYDYEKGLAMLREETTPSYDDSSGGSVSSSSEDNTDVSSENDDSSMALSDFDGPLRQPVHSPVEEKVPLDVSVSGVAEAYYAHQVVEPEGSFEGHRLDYVITQMDIARMTRNASRHLDVDSILNLPTVTYSKNKRRPTGTRVTAPPEDSRNPEEAWSFIMVPQDSRSVVGNPKDNHRSHLETNETCCVICLEEFQDGDRLRVLPCDHSFHVGCIDRWLSGSHSHHECVTSGCPTCKERPIVRSTSSSSSNNDGSVPSWAFARLGAELARS